MFAITITTRTALILAFVGTFGVSACRGKLPSGEEVAAEGEDDTPMPDTPGLDLPCGGADLMTDNLNCGICGQECVLSYPGSAYEAGSCKAGVCGPAGWSGCVPGDNTSARQNCAEVCIARGGTCVPNGCAGLTGMVFTVNFDGWGCNAYEHTPAATMSGDCDEPIPWGSPGEGLWDVQCCCDVQ